MTKRTAFMRIERGRRQYCQLQTQMCFRNAVLISSPSSKETCSWHQGSRHGCSTREHLDFSFRKGNKLIKIPNFSSSQVLLRWLCPALQLGHFHLSYRRSLACIRIPRKAAPAVTLLSPPSHCAHHLGFESLSPTTCYLTATLPN